METKKLIILFFTFLLVISCTREIWVSGENEPQEKVPVSLHIVLEGAAKTKAAPWTYDEFFPGIREEEQKVSNIFLVVFKNMVLEEFDYYTESNFIQDPDNFTINLQNDEEGDLLALEPGPHYFYAILNIPDDLYQTVLPVLEGQKGKLTRDVFERIITSYPLEFLTGNGDKFIMTNSTTPSVRGIYSQEQYQASNGELHNEVTITVEGQ
ncbi:MAG: hypothetical protein LIP01_02370 [Tannerellaceae bacterium]|nr:hypothetical protein [Tannerellaceae bacterium]